VLGVAPGAADLGDPDVLHEPPRHRNQAGAEVHTQQAIRERGDRGEEVARAAAQVEDKPIAVTLLDQEDAQGGELGEVVRRGRRRPPDLVKEVALPEALLLGRIRDGRVNRVIRCLHEFLTFLSVYVTPRKGA